MTDVFTIIIVIRGQNKRALQPIALKIGKGSQNFNTKGPILDVWNT